MGRLDDRVAIVTGAARGMGAATAALFVAEGARVLLTDVDEQGGAATAERIGSDARFVRHDVTSADDWETVIAHARAELGGPDILVNNAGVFIPAPLGETDLLHFRAMLEVNVTGVMLGMRAVRLAFEQAGGGVIVNLGSVAGLSSTPGQFGYGATKWAVRGMTKTAAAELGPQGIRVNAVMPGLIDTKMIAVNSTDYNDAVVAGTPLQRIGEPEDVARAILFLASDECSYVSGAELAVDGGLLA